MEKICNLQALSKQKKGILNFVKSKVIVELNRNHSLIKQLQSLDMENLDDKLYNKIITFYELAKISNGFEINDKNVLLIMFLIYLINNCMELFLSLGISCYF